MYVLMEKVREDFLLYLRLRNRSEQTIIGYGKDLRTFQRFLSRELGHAIHIEEVMEGHIEQYIQYLKEERGLQPRSQNRYITSIRSMYQFAFKRRMIQENIAAYVENVQYERREPTYLTVGELQLLFTHIEHPVVKIAIMTLAYTGLRISELTNLKLHDVNFNERVIRVIGKGQKERVVPIAEKLFVILEYYLRALHPATSPFFFATVKSGRISAPYINKIIRESVQAAGIKKRVSAHTMRHSFASYLVHQQVDIATLQRLLGHANIRTTSVYLHTDYEQLQQAVKGMDF